MIRVLCVCLGNICRSPLAEGLLLHKLQLRGWQNQVAVDSCGTGGWHAGAPADARMRQVAQSKNITLHSRARQIRLQDFHDFDYILAMDASNYTDILSLLPQAQPKTLPDISLLRDFSPGKPGRGVPDPYYGGLQGFEDVYDIVSHSLDDFLDFLQKKHTL